MVITSHFRHLLKAITWRLIALLDTIILSWLVLGNIEVGYQIGALELISKIVLFYVHERIWFKIPIFKHGQRHLVKTFSWRIVGSIDTVIIAWLVSGDVAFGFQLGALEVVTKLVLFYFHEELWYLSKLGIQKNREQQHVFKQEFLITLAERQKITKNKPLVIWFTGLSGSGKSTLSNALEIQLNNNNILTASLDGDNIRRGVNRHLSFTDKDRKENIRVVAEICKLFIQSGVVVLASFISPTFQQREIVRNIVGKKYIFEIFMDVSYEICEQRDPKGLYAKARSGKIKNFTGINQKYEKPKSPNARITSDMSIEESVDHVLPLIKKRILKKKNTTKP